MAKVSIKYEKITPFGGIFHVREQFSRMDFGEKYVFHKACGLGKRSFGDRRQGDNFYRIICLFRLFIVNLERN